MIIRFLRDTTLMLHDSPEHTQEYIFLLGNTAACEIVRGTEANVHLEFKDGSIAFDVPRHFFEIVD